MTDKLNGIKPGDRVRVTFEGITTQPTDGVLALIQDGTKDTDLPIWFDQDDINMESFQITRIEPELAVGDMVTWGSGMRDYEIVAFRDGRAILYDDGYAMMRSVSELARVPAK